MAPNPVACGALTLRQLQVLRLRALGFTNEAIAIDLRIHLQTVKKHVSLSYDALGVGCLPEALLVLGWLNVPEEAA